MAAILPEDLSADGPHGFNAVGHVGIFFSSSSIPPSPHSLAPFVV